MVYVFACCLAHVFLDLSSIRSVAFTFLLEFMFRMTLGTLQILFIFPLFVSCMYFTLRAHLLAASSQILFLIPLGDLYNRVLSLSLSIDNFQEACFLTPVKINLKMYCIF